MLTLAKDPDARISLEDVKQHRWGQRTGQGAEQGSSSLAKSCALEPAQLPPQSGPNAQRPGRQQRQQGSPQPGW
jgi:hypothetical protein